MSDVMFHKCVPGDACGLCGLIRDALGYTDVTESGVRSSLEKMLVSDDYFTLVAEANGETCGFVSIVHEISLEAGEYYRVLGLAVKTEYRKQGLGTALLTLAEGYAKSNGARLMTLSSNFKRTEAHVFYEKTGYEKTSYTFKKSL